MKNKNGNRNDAEHKANYKAALAEMEKMEGVFRYEVAGIYSGIAYHNGKLVEFKISEDGPNVLNEITLLQSVKYVENMYYVSSRLDLHNNSSFSPQGYLNWLRNIAGALKFKDVAVAAIANN